MPEGHRRGKGSGFLLLTALVPFLLLLGLGKVQWQTSRDAHIPSPAGDTFLLNVTCTPTGRSLPRLLRAFQWALFSGLATVPALPVLSCPHSGGCRGRVLLTTLGGFPTPTHWCNPVKAPSLPIHPIVACLPTSVTEDQLPSNEQCGLNPRPGRKTPFQVCSFQGPTPSAPGLEEFLKSSEPTLELISHY